MKSKILLFTTLLLAISISCNDLKTMPNDAIIVCGDSKVLIVDFPKQGDSIPNILWHWDAQYANDLPFEYRTRRFNAIDECKPTPDGKQLMISSSSSIGTVAIINIEDKKIMFYADVPNAHSIEILPDNKIVAAASIKPAGNKLMLFDGAMPENLLDSDSLYSAHGVVWDNKREVLYALGYDVLREYEISNDNKLVMNNEWTIPGISGHDLLMTPDGNGLFVTENTGAWLFDIEAASFSKIDNFPDAEDIKSINQHANGQYVYTAAEDSWWTYRVKLHNPSGVLSFPNLRVYKTRLYKPGPNSIN